MVTFLLLPSSVFISSYSFLDRTIRSAVEQHLFDINPSGDQSSEDSESTPRPPSPKVTATARQRRRQQREQHDDSLRHRDRNRYCHDAGCWWYQHESSGALSLIATLKSLMVLFSSLSLKSYFYVINMKKSAE